MPPIQPGEVRNPTGSRPRTLKDVQRLARKQSMDALTALIGVYKRPDGKLDRTADGRVVVAATSTVLKWAYGEPPTYDPTLERPETKIDLAGMSLDERRKLLAVMDRITTVVTDQTTDEEDGPDFDASRFATEPMTIEAQAELPPIWQPPGRAKTGPRPDTKKNQANRRRKVLAGRVAARVAKEVAKVAAKAAATAPPPVVVVSESVVAQPRPRGRPKKAEPLVAAASPKKRGRPPLKKKRGRPKGGKSVKQSTPARTNGGLFDEDF